MKIVYLHQYFATSSMSGGTRSFEFSRELVKKGHEVHVVTSFQGATKKRGWSMTIEEGVFVHWLTIPYHNKMSFPRRLVAFLKFAVLSTFKAASIRCDLVFATSTPLTIAFPGIVASIRWRVPFVFEVRDLWPEMPIAVGALKNPIAIWLAKSFEKISYRRAKHIIALSPGMRDGILRASRCDESKVTVIPNFCNTDLFLGADSKKRFDVLDAHRDKKVVLYAGTLGLLNNVTYLVDIARECARTSDSVIFVVVGDGADREKIKSRAEETGVMNKNFVMLPPMSKTDVSSMFLRATLTLSLFSDIREMWANSANKFFDGLAAGRPVVINYGGWQADVLQERGAGLRIPANDPVASAQILLDALSNESLVEEMAANARALAASDFSRTRAVNGFEGVIVDAVRNL